MEVAPSSAVVTPGLPSSEAPADKAPSRSAEGSPSPFADLVKALGHEAERGEATVRGVLRGAAGGGDLSSSDLLALQAGIYRYGETIDLAAKLVDKLGTDVRTVLQGPQ